MATYDINKLGYGEDQYRLIPNYHNSTVIPNDSNLNTYLESGWYHADSASGLTNTPLSTVVTFNLQVTSFNNKYVQKLYDLSTGTIWTRSGRVMSGVVSFSGWKRIDKIIPFVKGTQTAATGSWTGICEDIDALYDGLTIAYWLPRAGSGNATLNLTLKNDVTTGAKNCYYGGTTRLTTHYGAGNIIYLTYQSAANINGNSYQGWWAQSQYYASNNYNLSMYTNGVKAGPNKIFPYTIIMQLPDGRWQSIVTSNSTGITKTANTHGFLLGHVLYMYANATYNENVKVASGNYIFTQYSNVADHRYSFNTANNATNGTTAYLPIYLVGTIVNGLFYLDTTQWWTQTLPTEDDGKIYIYLGMACDYYRFSFEPTHSMYHFKNGFVREFIDDSNTVNGHTVNSDVPTNAVFTDTTYTPASATPLMDGTAAVGTSDKYAREDHVHPSDSSKVSVNANQGLTDTQKSNARTNIGLGAAAVKGVDTSITANSTSVNLPTSAAVASLIQSSFAANDAMIFKGTIGTGGTITSLPTAGNRGWTYKVITDGTYAGKVCEIGDLLICTEDYTTYNDNYWVAVQSNIDGAITKAGGIINGVLDIQNELSANSITAGNLVVNGNATFTNNLYGNLIGTVNGGTPVSTVANQGLTSTEQSNARANIGAGTSSLALGTSSTTAYRGDYGNTAYSHATDANRLNVAQSSGLYKIAATAQGHIASLSAITKDDITGLGIPAQNTQYPLATVNLNGLMSSIDFKKINPQLLNLNDDLNTIITTGWYYNENGSTALINAPTAQRFYLQVFGNDSNNIYQRLYGLRNYYRVYTSFSSGAQPAWTSWTMEVNTDASTSTAGLMTAAMVTKLNGIAEGAEVNQNAFSNVTVGSTTIAADGKTDTLTLVAGANVTLTPDATNDKITIAATDTDTKVTNTLATTTKAYITGTQTNTTNTNTQVFDTGVYLTTTAGQLNAKQYKVDEHVNLIWNSTTSALDFIFS